MRLQVTPLLSGQLEHKIFRKPVGIALNLFIEPFCWHTVNLGQIGIKDHPLPAQSQNQRFDRFQLIHVRTPFMENLPDDNRKLFTVLFQRLEARKPDFPGVGKSDFEILPAGLSEKMFEEDGAGDGVVEGVVGFAARTEFADTRFEFQSGD